MAEEKEVFKQVLKHKGFFDYSDLYSFCFSWMKDNGFGVSEKEYVEKIASNGKEIQIEWEGGKDVTDYIGYKIGVKWHILGLQDAEVEVDGKKQKMNKGELKMTFTATIIYDREHKWEDSPIWKTLRGIYDKYIIKTTVDEYKTSLKDKAKSFVNDVKAYLALEGQQ